MRRGPKRSDTSLFCPQSDTIPRSSSGASQTPSSTVKIKKMQFRTGGLSDPARLRTSARVSKASEEKESQERETGLMRWCCASLMMVLAVSLMMVLALSLMMLLMVLMVLALSKEESSQSR